MVYLSNGDSPLPERVAPVARVGMDGSVVLERPAPAPDGPIAGAWLGAGIVLPVDDLAALTPVARAAFLGLWRLWSDDGRMELADAAVSWGVAVDRADLLRLGRWVR